MGKHLFHWEPHAAKPIENMQAVVLVDTLRIMTRELHLHRLGINQ